MIQDALWSDGTRITAADFMCAFKRGLNPDTASRLADHFSCRERDYKTGSFQFRRRESKPSAIASCALSLMSRVFSPHAGFYHCCSQRPGLKRNGPYVFEGLPAGVVASRNPRWPLPPVGRIGWSSPRRGRPSLALLQSGARRSLRFLPGTQAAAGQGKSLSSHCVRPTILDLTSVAYFGAISRPVGPWCPQ